MEEKQNAVLGTAPLGRLMMKFALPCTVSLLVGALYNIVDQIFIGNSSVGTIGITATSVVFPLITIAMAFGLCGCLLNIFLDWLFIFPMDMGVAGAAIATTIGNVVSFLIVFRYLFRTRSFRLKASDFVPDLPAIGQIGKLGFSSFLTQLSIVIITIVSMNMLAKYGAQSQYGANDPQAIISVVMKVFTIAVNLAVGISAGCQPIFGFNYGAGRYDRVRKLLGMVMRSVLCIGVVATILFQTIPAQIIGIFGTNSQSPALYMEFGTRALRVYLLLILFTLVQKSASIFLQALGSAVWATLLSLIRDVIAFVPFTVLLPLRLGLDGILWAAPAADNAAVHPEQKAREQYVRQVRQDVPHGNTTRCSTGLFAI